MRTVVVDELQHAFILAEREAVLLLALSTAEIPSKDKDLKQLFHSQIVEIAIRFAINARRYLELSGERPTISQVLRPLSSGQEGVTFETSLWKALNGIIHARYLDTSFHNSPISGFPIGSTEWAAVIVFETDQKPTTFLDCYSMAWSFLEISKAEN